MKRIYVNPKLEVIKIATQQMLASSTLQMNSVEVDGDKALSREFDFDFEDEEY